ncbi:hypothetical protein BDF14DRAFT_1772474 [Spinellus fusiger]|nr:hypothetical protein BDF14DRAFT_1772474 [Spinellus fusiger]
MDYDGAINAGWNSVLLDRDPIDYMPNTSFQGNVDKISTLTDLYPYLLKNFSE